MKLDTSVLTLSIVLAELSFATFSIAEDTTDPYEYLHMSSERMEEWNDWRFGLFIHWGPWSQREVGYIWKMVNEEGEEEGSKSFELYKTFNPVKFDPNKWAKAAKNAGMKYVVFVVKHHDGVNNYDTEYSELKTTSPLVPYHSNPNADLTKAIVDAFRAEGLAIGLYYSHIDWHHKDGRYFSRDYWNYDPDRIESYPESWERFVKFEQDQLRELLTNYGKIDIAWFDIHWPHAGVGTERIEHPKVRKAVLDTLSMMKELQPNIIFNDRGTDQYGGFYTPEQQVPEFGLPGNWESNITITNNRGFWYKGENVSAKSDRELIHMLIDITSKGGNFLMNVGPRPDGELSQTEYDALAAVGSWMDEYGESIHGTRKSLFLDLPWGESTTKGNTVYLHVLDWPSDGKLRVPGLRNEIKKAYHLSDPKQKNLRFSKNGDDQIIDVGSIAPNEIASVVAVEIAGEPDINNVYRQIGNNPITLSTGIAKIESETAKYNFGKATRKGNFIQDIKTPGDALHWEFNIQSPGKYVVAVEYATQNDQAGSRFTLEVDEKVGFRQTVHGTADWSGDILQVQRKTMDTGERHNNLWLFQTFEVGTIVIDESGKHRITLIADSIKKDYLAFVKSVSLVPEL